MGIKRIVLLIAVSAAMAFTATAQDIQAFAHHQLTAWPQSRLLDIYKSCFQDFMGPEHLVVSRDAASNYLLAEIDAVDTGDLLPWYYEPCGLQGNYYRVSLRCVKEGLVDAGLLLDAFICSANAAHPSVLEWRERWNAIESVLDSMNLQLKDYQTDRQLIDSILQQGHYAVSHSPDYREAYNPHYRIVKREIFEAQILPRIKEAPKQRSQLPKH